MINLPSCSVMYQNLIKKRNTTGRSDSRRKHTYMYYLKNKQGEKHEICRRFFLAVLGFEPKNDKVLRNVLKKVKINPLLHMKIEEVLEIIKEKLIDR